MKQLGVLSTVLFSFVFWGATALAYPQEQHQENEKQAKPEKQAEPKQQQAKPERQAEARPQQNQPKQQEQHAQQQNQNKQQEQRAQQQQQSQAKQQEQHAQQQQNQNRQQQQHAQQQQKQNDNNQRQQNAQQQRQDRAQHVQVQRTEQQQRTQQVQQRNDWRQHRASNWSSEHRTWQQRGGYNGYRIPDAYYSSYYGQDHSFRVYSMPFLIVGGFPRFQYGGYWFSVVDPYPDYWGDDWYQTDDVYVAYNDGGYYLYNRRYPDRPGVAISISL